MQWVNSGLMGRAQKALLNGVTHSWQPVTSEVPQGTILGPILFSVFINNLDAGLKCRLRTIAGDTKLGGAVDCF